MTRSIFAWIGLCFLLCWQTTYAQSGKVIGIKDGDTVELLLEEVPVTVRLSDIDAPEKGQPYGTVAKKFLSTVIFGKVVTLRNRQGKDRNGRLIAEIWLGSRNINLEMVERGLAWHFKKYSAKAAYANAEVRARTTKTGLWKETTPIAPWVWRKMKKDERDNYRALPLKKSA